jgi:pimeloyl-ACP methyl ester carboxylesterase
VTTNLESTTAYGLSDDPGWRDITWEDQIQTAQIAGSRVSYVDVGSGSAPPFVLLHGIGGCWQNWIQNIPRLALERRVIALDFPGFGESTLPRRPLTLSHEAAVVDDLCERLSVDRVVLVGNSMGGMIACDVAARFPARIERLMLAAPGGVSTANPLHGLSIAPQMVALQSVRVQRALARVRGRTAEHPLKLIIEHPRSLERGLARAALGPGGSRPGFGLISLDLALGGTQRGFRDRLRSIGCPTLIVWGRNDRLLPVRDASAFARAIADSRTVLWHDTGHVPMLEHPREFNRLALDFASGS